MLLKRTEESTKEHIVFGSVVDSISALTEAYIWYKAVIHSSLAQYSESTEDGETTFSFSYAVNPELSAGNIDRLKSLPLYPNPAQDIIRIQGLAQNIEIYNVSVVDITGKQVLSQTTNNPVQSIDISPLESDVYVLKVSTDRGVATRNFMVN